MSFIRVIRSGAWLYANVLLSNFLGYLYWLIASSFVSPNAIGSAAAILALQGMLVTVFSFGLPSGLPRFIGLNRNDYQKLSSYFLTSVFFTILLNLPVAVIFLLASFAGLGILNLTSLELTLAVILFLLSSWPCLFTSLFNSLLRSEIVAFVQITSTLLRILISVALLYLGFGFLGIVSGFIVAALTMDFLLVFHAARLFREFKVGLKIQLSNLKNLLKAGFPSWVPNTLIILGQSVGVLSIYWSAGGTETGLYYLAFAIASIIYSLPTSILSLMFPVLSGMKDGRKNAISGAIRLSLAITAPVVLTLTLYPELPLSLLGPKYVQASHLLEILVLGAIVSPITSGYASYVYSIGRYSHVAMMGIVTSLGRLALYAILISPLGAIGIALTYALGEIIALAVVVPSARRTGYKLGWNQYAKTIVVPTIPAILIYSLRIHPSIGIPALLLVSLIVYGRFRIILKSDLVDLSQAFLSKDHISRIYPYTRPIVRLMYGE